MRDPDFFLIGAPKCGTTSLVRWLAEHRQVFMSAIKEPHYYSTDLGNRSIVTERAYRNLFRGIKAHHKAVGEASTWYLYSKKAVENIEHGCAGAKYIVMTRDPVDMACSLYYHNVRKLHEDRTTFEEAWRLQSSRALGHSVPKTCSEPDFLQYYAACSLGSMLQRLLDRVPPQRVLHLSLEDMKKDPDGELRRVRLYLNLDDDGRNIFPVVNQARHYRFRSVQYLMRLGAHARRLMGIQRGFGLSGFNEKKSEKTSLADDFLKELHEVFDGQRKLLSAVSCQLKDVNVPQ